MSSIDNLRTTATQYAKRIDDIAKLVERMLEAVKENIEGEAGAEERDKPARRYISQQGMMEVHKACFRMVQEQAFFAEWAGQMAEFFVQESEFNQEFCTITGAVSGHIGSIIQGCYEDIAKVSSLFR